jgi:hypothetical protein
MSCLGLTTNGITDTNQQLKITIPDELKGIELQIIILPLMKENSQQIEFFTDAELHLLPSVQPVIILKDDEDYSNGRYNFLSKYLF